MHRLVIYDDEKEPKRSYVGQHVQSLTVRRRPI